MVEDLSKEKFDLTAMDSMYQLCLLNPQMCRFIIKQFQTISGISNCCLDLIVDEESTNIYAIDLNDMPSFKQGDTDLHQVMIAYWKSYKSQL